MYTETRILTDIPDVSALSLACRPEEALFLDIATTGLSREENRIFLISCAHLEAGTLSVTQWFDETGNEEPQLLLAFLEHAGHYSLLVHYNGKRFDLPFLARRMALCGLSEEAGSLLTDREGIDLYQVAKPYRKLFALPSFSQQSLEQFFRNPKIGAHTGEETASGFARYLETRDPVLRDRLLRWSTEDLCGILFLTKLLSLKYLRQDSFTAVRAQANRYRGADGTPREELVIHAAVMLPENFFPTPAMAQKDGVYLQVRGNRLTVKVPLFTGTLRFFHENYREYWYLPEEDMAVHKSVAEFTDRSHRVPAAPENCYTKQEGTFLPAWAPFHEPLFRQEYGDSLSWFLFTNEKRRSQAFFSGYAAYLFLAMLEPVSGRR